MLLSPIKKAVLVHIHCAIYTVLDRIRLQTSLLIVFMYVYIFLLSVVQALVVVVALFGCHWSQAAGPHLLISKVILNEYTVEGKDLTIQYSLYNIGEG